MKFVARAALIGLALSGLAFWGAAQTKPPVASAASLAPDKGHFKILLSGQSIGNEDFDISSSDGKWIVRGTTEAHAPGGSDMKTTGELHLAADGTPIHYVWSADAPKPASGSVDFDGGTAKVLTNVGGAQPYHEDFKFTAPLVVVLDNNLYEQYAVLARLYNWSAGGDQTFPVVIPQDITPGTITVSEAGGAGGAELVVKSADLEIHLFCDASHKLLRLEVPASNVVVQRE
jgi:hypothetical protein